MMEKKRNYEVEVVKRGNDFQESMAKRRQRLISHWKNAVFKISDDKLISFKTVMK